MAPEISEELLQAADQYMLEPLKRLCEAAIAADLSTNNLPSIYDLSENFNAPQLGRHCMLYALEHYEELVCPLCSSFSVLLLLQIRAQICHADWDLLRSCSSITTLYPIFRSTVRPFLV